MSSTTPISDELPPDFGTHNMFAFGRETVFLSHLPMFMAPHDAQLILEVALEKDADGSLLKVWSRERESHPDQRVYTMMPQRFALSTLYTPDPPVRRSFRGRFSAVTSSTAAKSSPNWETSSCASPTWFTRDDSIGAASPTT